MLDLPAGIRACLFDLDGVLTQTAQVHARAWKDMFDAFLAKGHERPGEDRSPFALPHDYDRHVDGKPRVDGVRSFLAARGIEVPEGRASDPPDADTVHGLGTRKNILVMRLIRDEGVEVYPSSVVFAEKARDQGLRRAVVSSSANCEEILRWAAIDHLFEERVDGLVAVQEGLPGKPAPDTFLEGARRLGVEPAEAAVFEDALAGVEAGRAGGFGWVVGVNRSSQADELRSRGADVVVDDLAELLELPR